MTPDAVMTASNTVSARPAKRVRSDPDFALAGAKRLVVQEGSLFGVPVKYEYHFEGSPPRLTKIDMPLREGASCEDLLSAMTEQLGRPELFGRPMNIADDGEPPNYVDERAHVWKIENGATRLRFMELRREDKRLLCKAQADPA